MDSSLINVDIQTNYIRVTLKGKSLQLALSEEIMPDSSTAQRSQTTGQLVIKMPKLNKVIRPVKQEVNTSKTLESKNEEAIKKPSNYLEVDESKYKNRIDLANIVSDNEKSSKQYLKYKKSLIKERDNSPDFVDSSDVPPLS
jgi:protein TilB